MTSVATHGRRRAPDCRRLVRRAAALALVPLACAAVAARAQTPTPSRDLMNAVYDVASPAAVRASLGGKPMPPSTRHALDTLAKARLLAPARLAAPQPTGLLKRWGDALQVANARPVAAEIGAVRDAVVKGDATRRRAAVEALFRKQGRALPAADGLKQIDQRLNQAFGAEPEESKRQTVRQDGSTVELSLAPRTGQVEVAVVEPGPDGTPVRTVFRGQQQTQPTADGQDLEVVAAPGAICTVDQKASSDGQSRLAGTWKGSDGNDWTLALAGAAFTALMKRPDGRTLAYTGTYSLGKVTAFHGFSDIADIGDDLPADVRAQLVAWQPKIGFTLRLDLCSSDATLAGTWSSQSVTYKSLTHKVGSVHDPYDVPLTLSSSPKSGVTVDFFGGAGITRAPGVQP